MKKVLTIILIIIAAVLVGLAFLSDTEGEDAASSASESKTAKNESAKTLGTLPDVTLQTYEGENVKLASLRGDPLIINSWAVWCPFCKEEMKDFAALQEEFGDRVRVIAVNREESLEKAKGFTDSIGVTDTLTLFLDGNDSFYQNIGGFTMPETIFVNESGEILIHKRGFMKLDEMREKTRELLN